MYIIKELSENIERTHGTGVAEGIGQFGGGGGGSQAPL